MQYKIISADCHVDLPWLPADLFSENASAELREGMPYVRETDKGRYWVSNNAASIYQN
jgi:hypothetical protein